MQIAIIGTTASGKSDLGIKLAKKVGGIILSLDSLSIYKEIDIASAKPTKEEMGDILHFGIDEIYPNEAFNVTIFFDLYKKSFEISQKKNVPLIIVGGTSFYLKAMLSGLSDKPLISEENRAKTLRALRDLKASHELIKNIDFEASLKIEENDSYRIEKWLEIYYETEEVPSVFLKRTLREPIIKNLPIFEIETDREVLRKRIEIRTKKMIEAGLVDEVARLEKKYTREPNCMKAIGLKEVIDYFDGIYSLEEMGNKIATNTAKLAKRQRTFNKTQFLEYSLVKKPLEDLEEEILKVL
ncbi:MAG: tRNA (adenosine(37)-N6)-dimethylallyltransferase MiaA [Campylobacteraceae bacterium]